MPDCQTVAVARYKIPKIVANMIEVDRYQHSREKILQRNFRLPYPDRSGQAGQSDYVAVSPDKVGPTGR